MSPGVETPGYSHLAPTGPTVSPRKPMQIFDGLPVGARVRFKMRAMNETGHGAFGEEVEIVVS